MTDPQQQDLEVIAEMSEDRLSKLLDLNSEEATELLLEGKYEAAIETAMYYQLLRDEMNRR